MENTTETTHAEVSKEQLDTFFESGGETVPEVAEPESISVEKEILEDKRELAPAKEEKYVPLAALHEERTRRKEMQSEIDRMKHIINEAFQARQAPVDPPPSFDDDPIQNLKNENDAIKQHLQSQINQSNAAHNQQDLVNTYRRHASDFTRTTPDFNEAYKFISDQRQAEYVEAGYSPEDAAALLIQDEIRVVYKALQDEVNPAERVYNLAKVRGYKAAEKTGEKVAKMEIAEKGIKAGKSLSSASGISDSEVTLESLADLPSEEFNKMWKKLISDKA